MVVHLLLLLLLLINIIIVITSTKAMFLLRLFDWFVSMILNRLCMNFHQIFGRSGPQTKKHNWWYFVGGWIHIIQKCASLSFTLHRHVCSAVNCYHRSRTDCSGEGYDGKFQNWVTADISIHGQTWSRSHQVLLTYCREMFLSMCRYFNKIQHAMLQSTTK